MRKVTVNNYPGGNASHENKNSSFQKWQKVEKKEKVYVMWNIFVAKYKISYLFDFIIKSKSANNGFEMSCYKLPKKLYRR